MSEAVDLVLSRVDALSGLAGMVVLTGYACDLYTDRLHGWESYATSTRISADRGTAMRTEALWINPACSDASRRAQGSLFGEAAA